jgi:hypothetical protein
MSCGHSWKVAESEVQKGDDDEGLLISFCREALVGIAVSQHGDR